MLLDLLMHHHRAPIRGGAGRTNGVEIDPSGIKPKRTRMRKKREQDILLIGRAWTF